MRAMDLGRLSATAIIDRPLRSILTMLGIIVGISAVVLLTAIGEGVRLYVLAEFTQFGTNLIAVVPGKTTTFGISGATISTVRPLSLDDAEALKDLHGVDAVVPVVQGNAAVESGRLNRRTMVLGVGSRVPEVWRMPVATGSFLADEDLRSTRAFAVLGAKLHRELFADTNSLGKRIRIGGDPYRVVGVMAAKGQMLGFDLDDTIYIPVNRALEMFDRQGVMEIDILFNNSARAENMAGQIKKLLINKHGREDFTVITQDQMLDVLDSIMDILTLGVAAIGSISLLVGAVGIATIMTITVTERTAEVGLLRALGARRASILLLFLSESAFLSGLAGLTGCVLVISIVQILQTPAIGLPVEIAWNYVGLALALSLIIGIAAGILPALRAAAMQPLDALRAE